MNTFRNILLLELIIISAFSMSCAKPQNELIILKDFVRMDSTKEEFYSPYEVSDTIAAKIAEIVLVGIYGEHILMQTPFEVCLYQDSIWLIRGNTLEPIVGGNAYIEIRRCDGKILNIYHGK